MKDSYNISSNSYLLSDFRLTVRFAKMYFYIDKTIILEGKMTEQI